MALGDWLAFCTTEAVLCLSPGPAVLLVVSMALARGLRPSLWAAGGILTANGLYFALSGTGVAAVLVTSRELFLVLKWTGAAYLIWLGLRMLRAHAQGTLRAPRRPVARAFARGIVVQGANPKALVFFAALLPQFIDPSGPVTRQLTLLGISSIAIEAMVLAGYAWIGCRTGQVASERAAGLLERAGGAMLIAAGARLAAIRSD